MFSIFLVSLFQVLGDLVCAFVALICYSNKKSDFRPFFIINSFTFFILAIGDVYYNYEFRIAYNDIKKSIGFATTFPIFIFQLSQAYNWYSFIKRQKIIIFSIYNLPYLLFAIVVISVLVCYFNVGNGLHVMTSSYIVIWYQSFKISLDMLVWFFSIVCLARTRSLEIMLLALGCLMVISSDLTTRCLFMFEMNKVATTGWIHVIWTMGILSMMVGFIICLKPKQFYFCHPESIQAESSSLMLMTSLIAFLMGFIFLYFLNLTHIADIYSILWKLPIILMFTMIISVLLGNGFSYKILLPINHFLSLIESFNTGIEDKKNIYFATNIYEFKKLGEFICSSFSKLSSQLDREIKIATQVAHDIRSPLAALDIGIKCLSEVSESKRILLRDATDHIRDIINNLEKNPLPEKNKEKKSITQLAALIGYVLLERKLAFSNKSIKINQRFGLNAYSIFVEVVPSEIKRIITNIINNACESVLSQEVSIDVDLYKKNNNHACITVSDNGSGIPEDIVHSLFKRGFTTKSEGSGLGLCYAKEMLEKWGSTIEIFSEENKGTTVSIKFPLRNSPNWFVDCLIIPKNSTLVCIDDSLSIWNAWQERFRLIGSDIDLRYCHSKEDFMFEINRASQKSYVYFVDYEFFGKNYTGFDLINMILSLKDKKNKIYLVTSRSSEEKIQKFCMENGIHMIPKSFVSEIPIKIHEPFS